MVERILVIQTAFVGDLLLAIPLLRRLRHRYKGCEVDLVCRQGLGSLMFDLQLVERFFEVTKGAQQRESSAAVVKALRSQLRGGEYSLLLNLHQSFRTAQMVRKIPARKKVGYAQWWNFGIYQQRIKRPMKWPEALRSLLILSAEDRDLKSQYDLLQKESHEPGWATSKIPSWASMALPVPTRRELEERLAGDEKFCQSMQKVFEISKRHQLFRKKTVFLAPGSVWATKRWTAEGFGKVAQMLQNRGYQAVFVGAPEERELCQEVSRGVAKSVNLCGQTSLFETYQLFIKGVALICNDSGAMHLAAAADLPTVAIFGPTTLDLGYRPWNPRACVVQKDLECRPCGRHGAEKCPLGTHECMAEVNEWDVMSAFDRLIDTPSH